MLDLLCRDSGCLNSYMCFLLYIALVAYLPKMSDKRKSLLGNSNDGGDNERAPEVSSFSFCLSDGFNC